MATSRDRPRVRLRPPSRTDEAEFLDRVRASRSLHGTWSSLPETPERFAELLVDAMSPAEAVYLIVRVQDGAIAGIARLSQIFLGNFRSAYLGYSAFVPFDGQGYMTEGLRLVMREAFGTIGLHRVEANVQPDNERSIALVERLGFRREGFSPRYLKLAGRWRDHARYAMLAEDFPATLSSTRRSPPPPPPTGRTRPRRGRGPGARGGPRPPR